MTPEPQPGPEPRLADPPAEFDTYQLVLLVRPLDAPDIDEATAELVQRQHLGHLANMRDQGHVVTSGPLLGPSDERLRGISIYRAGSIEEARRLAESDPAVKIGRLAVELMTWVTPKGELPTHD